MSTQTQEIGQYELLHNEFLPGLYRAAFYLLGDGETAQEATARAWESTYADPLRRADKPLFAAALESNLVKQCFLLAKKAPRYRTTTPDGMDQPLLAVLAALQISDRALLVFAAVQGRTPAEISAALGQPEHFVTHRLHKLTTRVCNPNLALCR